MGSPPDGMRLGRYLLFDRIASGGMASVHLGRLIGEVGFARIVAIKRLHPNYARMPEFVAMLTDEARLAARIRHPNVVTTLDVVAEEGELFLVMEYAHGESLGRLWRSAARAGALVPPPIAVAVVAGALYGLHAAHEARSERGEPLGLVHRDVSPQNILVDVDGVPRVLDFGIAKAAWRMQITHEGQLKGKVHYISPEQIAGLDIDRRVDLYAISVVLWELLTGVRYIDTGDVISATKRILEMSALPPSAMAPGLPPALDEAVLRGLSRDRSARFATAKEMAAALEAAMPPATSREVGEWVQAAAREPLAARAALIARIEAQQPAEPPGDRATPAPRGSWPTAPSLTPSGGPPRSSKPEISRSPATAAASAARAAPGAPFPASEAPTEVNADASPPPLADTGAAPPGAARRPRVGLLLLSAAGAFVVLLGAGSLAVLGALSRDNTSQPASASVSAPASVSVSAPVSASVPAPVSASVSAPVSASVSVSASASVSAPVSASASSPAPPRSSRPPAPRPRRSKPGCDPPFFIAKDGTKQYKLECL